MKRNIHIAVLGANVGWEQVLSQIGVSWTRIQSVATVEISRQSCVVIAREMDHEEQRAMSNYLSSGGAVIDTTGQLLNQKPVRRYFGALTPAVGDSSFRHIEEIQVHHRCLVHPSSESLQGLVWFDPSPARSLAFLGLPMQELSAVQPLAHTQFRSATLPAAAERTAARSSHPYIEIVLTILKTLHHKSGLPLVHTWWMPDNDKQAATFRIDSDYGTKSSVDSAAAPAVENNIPATWFLHTKAHENWLDDFHRFAGHEFGLHCYRHYEFAYEEQFRSDILRGSNIMHKHGFKPVGYAAPYGYWSETLGNVLSEFKFHYSSEFGYDYDSLPSFSPTSKKLQLPIHPLSIGSFSRFRFSDNMISDYFDEFICLKQLQHMPLHLYHHPKDGHEELLRTIFNRSNHENSRWMTYSEWANWWLKRSSVSHTPVYDTESCTVHLKSQCTIPAAIHASENKFLITNQSVIEMEREAFSPYIAAGLVKLVEQRRLGKRLSAMRLKKDQLMTTLWRNRV